MRFTTLTLGFIAAFILGCSAANLDDAPVASTGKDIAEQFGDGTESFFDGAPTEAFEGVTDGASGLAQDIGLDSGASHVVDGFKKLTDTVADASHIGTKAITPHLTRRKYLSKRANLYMIHERRAAAAAAAADIAAADVAADASKAPTDTTKTGTQAPLAPGEEADEEEPDEEEPEELFRRSSHDEEDEEEEDEDEPSEKKHDEKDEKKKRSLTRRTSENEEEPDENEPDENEADENEIDEEEADENENEPDELGDAAPNNH